MLPKFFITDVECCEGEGLGSGIVWGELAFETENIA